MTSILPVLNLDGKTESRESIGLPDFIFGLSESEVALKIPLVHQVATAQLAAARQGTSSTKSRADVSGGGAKPHRQKGTGRARQGSIRSPQFRGGGVVHGPHPRSYEQRTPKKMKAGALRAVLSSRAQNDHIHVAAGFVDGIYPSAKVADAAVSAIAHSKKILVVANRDDELTWKSLRNVKRVHLLDPGQLNAYDVANSEDVIFTADAIERFIDRVAASRIWRTWVREDKAFLRERSASHRPVGEPAQTIGDIPLGRDHATPIVDYTSSLTGDDIRVAAMNHGDVQTYTSQVPGVDGTAFATDDIDGVAVERHAEFVLVSWPTNLDGGQAADVMFGALDSEDSGQAPWFLSTIDDDTDEREGDFDRQQARQRASKARTLRLELDKETLVWRSPEGDERQARFIAYELQFTGDRLLELLELTADPAVRQLVARVLGDHPRDVLPLGAST